MTIESHLSESHGHPWDKRPGFDLMEVIGDSSEELDAFIAEAEKAFWAIWISGEVSSMMKQGVVLYKPSGIDEPWTDDMDARHPGIVRQASETAKAVVDGLPKEGERWQDKDKEGRIIEILSDPVKEFVMVQLPNCKPILEPVSGWTDRFERLWLG